MALVAIERIEMVRCTPCLFVGGRRHVHENGIAAAFENGLAHRCAHSSSASGYLNLASVERLLSNVASYSV